MLTQLGKFLRQMRMDNNEILKEMATKLDVTSAFLSAIENGKKKMQSTMRDNIVKIYKLTKSQEKELDDAILESNDSVAINISSTSTAKKRLAISFARTFGEMDEEDVKAFAEYLENRSKGD